MMKRTIYLLPIFIVTLMMSFSYNGECEVDEPKNFIVLELFTSQGCSSCPPADKVLEKLALKNDPEVLLLSFHVDYWDYIGWKDPFSKNEYSQRQGAYDAALKSTVYTPQLIVNGRIHW